VSTVTLLGHVLPEEPVDDPDVEVRLRCLDLAVRAVDTGRSSGTVLDMARDFYEFVNGAARGGAAPPGFTDPSA